MKRIKVLILTAGFGDGHNSAAKALAGALEDRAVAKVADPCAEALPRLNNLLRKSYRRITTYFPRLWHRIYRSTDQQDFSRPTMPFMRHPEAWLEGELREFQPDVVISTYPLYPYFLDRIFNRDETLRRPVVTVITDSLEINAAWRRAPSDRWLVTDPHTKEALAAAGLDPAKLVDTGFPVSGSFENLTPLSATAAVDPFRVLFFPTARKPEVRNYMQAVLEASPQTEITVVLGRNVRKLYRRAEEVKKQHPGRVKLIGWTRRVPELLSSHHLVLGKAGGATVHEALAAQCPMLVHHLVPGQEEGNLGLLQLYGAGELTPTDHAVRLALQEMLANDAAGWRRRKIALEKVSRPAAAREAAGVILALA